MHSKGNSFGDSIGNAIQQPGSIRRPVPPWKFGVSMESYWEDRGDM
jgi:hypothetical protein